MTYIIVILILILIYIIIDAKNPKHENEKDEKKNYNSKYILEDYKKYYKPKRYVISLNELNFYNTLTEIANELNLTVFSQVSLYNIVEVLPNLNYTDKTKYLNKITKKSIDFVMVEKNNCRIKLCIELDDSTHKQENRKKRDFESIEKVV